MAFDFIAVAIAEVMPLLAVWRVVPSGDLSIRRMSDFRFIKVGRRIALIGAIIAAPELNRDGPTIGKGHLESFAISDSEHCLISREIIQRKALDQVKRSIERKPDRKGKARIIRVDLTCLQMADACAFHPKVIAKPDETG